jgi:hypothetical protein
LGYYDALLQQFDRAVSEEFLRRQHRLLLLSAAEPGALLQALEAHHNARSGQRFDREVT